MSSLNQDLQDMDEMRKEFLVLFVDFHNMISRVTAKVKAEKDYDRPTLCDIGWQFREIEKCLDELRKEAKARKELIGKLIALRVTEECLADPSKLEEKMTIRGHFCSGSPEMRQQAALPKARTEEYRALCRHFGVKDENVLDEGIIQFSFSRLAEHVTRLIESGKPMPKGVNKTYPVYSTVYRTKKR